MPDGWRYCPKRRVIRFRMRKDCLNCRLYKCCKKAPLFVENVDEWLAWGKPDDATV